MRILLFTFLFFVSIKAGAEPRFANLRAGPLAVGWKLVQHYDYARTYKGLIDSVSGEPTHGERARPIQTQIWYPARRGGVPVTYADYVRTEASEEDFTRSAGEIDAFLSSVREDAAGRVGARQASDTFEQRMGAVRDASSLEGQFPVVIYAPGAGGSGREAADLGEYLASHG